MNNYVLCLVAYTTIMEDIHHIIIGIIVCIALILAKKELTRKIYLNRCLHLRKIFFLLVIMIQRTFIIFCFGKYIFLCKNKLRYSIQRLGTLNDMILKHM